MKPFFTEENKLLEILDIISNIAILNFLCIVGCIPIITAGASITATYSVGMKLVKNEEGYIIKDYIKSFKENFKTSTSIWLFMIVVIGVVVFDFYIASIVANEMISNIFKFIFMVIAIIVLFMMTYVFAIVAKFENSNKNTLINSILMSVENLPFTAVMVFFNMTPIMSMMIFANSFAYIIFFYVVIGFGMTTCMNSILLNRVFTRYIN